MGGRLGTLGTPHPCLGNNKHTRQLIRGSRDPTGKDMFDSVYLGNPKTYFGCRYPSFFSVCTCRRVFLLWRSWLEIAHLFENLVGEKKVALTH